MKKLISSIALLLCAIMAQAADITEDFSTLAKGKYGAGSEQSVTLPSGEWMALKMELKENGGVKQLTPLQWQALLLRLFLRKQSKESCASYRQ